ncbi:Phosphoribosylformimino-5-aminoimidazole carboxamide ribotide isomerase [Auriscalpium vulgare]|uniref:Phosphoribosylformimino-5-aminoimidazole carboxamide ribotide isomerase n=1 Tax=Auriscalpium vulgare TaxID=40419 RepID=A0ACB8SBP7_9AGAM|nr:Phosphoribosylformimino-5-aminoimidazole carboxamide ribotide isomerase [Auriscalpium vulgare]
MSAPPRRSLFRPCIDLHGGQVKQIVGGTLSEDTAALRTNFVSSESPAYFATLYKEHGLLGGHLIKLGAGNEQAAEDALKAWPGGLQIGGGINDQNAHQWISLGASKVIVTSYLFPGTRFSLERLQGISSLVGKERLVVDVSCRRRGDKWLIAMNKWQDITDMEVCQETLDMLSEYCSEFLIHAADVEGLCEGIDEALVAKLGEWVRIPTTYAGGAKDLSDVDLVERLSGGRVDLTYGSSLDIFGGKLVRFQDLVQRNQTTATRDP